MYGAHQINLGLFSLSFESVIATLMTLSILILSEILPKTVGAIFWQKLTPFTVRSLKVLVIVLMPFVWLSKWVTRLVKTEKGRSVFSRADFAAMTDVGLKSGALD